MEHIFKRIFYLTCLLLVCSHLLFADKPYISIITPIYKAESFIEGFLENITGVSIFDRCELIIVNGHSPENENPLIEKYIKTHNNISAINLEEVTTLYSALNIGIKAAKSDYIYYAAVDNRIEDQALEKLAAKLDEDHSIDCVYSDYLATEFPNETIENNSSRWIANLPNFDPRLLGWCLMGPQPLWRKQLHDRFGYFKDDFVACGNWEFWNRICRKGARCARMDFISTLYYQNPQGVTTTELPEIAEKRKEESEWIYRTYCSYWGDNPLSSLTNDHPEKPFVIFIPSYNNAKWYEHNLDSVFNQNYSNYRVIYVDDGSPDGTADLVEQYIQANNLQERVQLIRNEKRKGALANYYRAVHLCKPEEIVVSLDGDDWLSHDNVLIRLNQEYANPDVWLTYGQFASLFDYKVLPIYGASKEVPPNVIATNTVRDHPFWLTSALRTFYAGLFHKIKKEDLLYEGDFFQIACDVAMMMPMMEMAGDHSRFISDVLYIYNRFTPINDDKTNRPFQVAMDLEVRSRGKYTPVASYIPAEKQSMRKIYVTTGQWGDLFAEGNPFFDRDHSLEPLIRLRDELRDRDVELIQTHTLKNLEDPLAIICFDIPTEQEFQYLLQYPKEKRLLFTWEPPTVVPNNFKHEYHQHFERIFTWADDLVDNDRYFKFCYPYMHRMINEVVDFQEKKFCALIANNKQSPHLDELYSARIQTIHFFEQNAPEVLDLFGHGWNGNFKTYRGSIPSKVDTLKNYKFCICYENLKDMKGYVTEKIFDAFHAGCVPVYYGAPNITDSVPQDCFIDRRRFATEQELYDHLVSLSETEYNTYVGNIRKYLETTDAARYSSEAFVRFVEHQFAGEKSPYYFCTAANSKYFQPLLNMIEGVHKHNYEELGEIAVFDLGLSLEQILALQEIEKVVIYPVEMVHPDLLTPFKTRNWGKTVPGWYAWKPVCIKQAMDIYPDVLWIDGGTTVLRPLNDLFAHIRDQGYFFHNGSPWSLKQESTRYVVETFHLESIDNQWMLGDQVKGLEAGFMGITRSIYKDFVMPMYELSKDLRNYEDDGTAGEGFGCSRHDLTLFSIMALFNKYHIFHHFENPKEDFNLTVEGEKKPFHISCNPCDRTPTTHIFCSRNSTDLASTNSRIRRPGPCSVSFK